MEKEELKIMNETHEIEDKIKLVNSKEAQLDQSEIVKEDENS